MRDDMAVRAYAEARWRAALELTKFAVRAAIAALSDPDAEPSIINSYFGSLAEYEREERRRFNAVLTNPNGLDYQVAIEEMASKALAGLRQRVRALTGSALVVRSKHNSLDCDACDEGCWLDHPELEQFIREHSQCVPREEG